MNDSDDIAEFVTDLANAFDDFRTSVAAPVLADWARADADRSGWFMAWQHRRRAKRWDRAAAAARTRMEARRGE